MRRFILSVECAMVLFACAAGPGAFEVWRHGAEQSGGYIAVVGVPGTAALLLLALCTGLPTLVSVDRLQFPLPITLPIVFGAMIMVAEVVWSSRPLEILRNPHVFRYAELWTRPPMVLLAVVAGAACLGLLTLLREEPR